jgi:hypothetical protein
MFQLERTLGTKIERLSLGGDRIERKEQPRERISSLASLPSAQRAKMVMLPGEVLQAQLEG